MKPTIRDVAKLAGVSISTVSRVMNAPETVVPEKRKRVQEAIEQLKYQPNAFARGLIYKKSETFGVMIPDIENPYYSGLLRGIQDAAVQLNHSVIICNTDRDRNRMIAYARNLFEKQADGIIYASDVLFSEFHDEMKRSRLPYVLVSTEAPEYDVPSVDIDNEQAAYEAVRHLIELGHRDIGMISFPVGETISGGPRLEGFFRAVREAGFDHCKANVEFAAHRFEDAYAAAERLLAKAPRLTAIFAASDEFAMGTIMYARDHGRAVPDDLSVVGFDDIRMAHMFIPRLTTIEQPVYQMGVRAVRKLHELVENGRVTELRERLPHRLIVRESTARPPV